MAFYRETEAKRTFEAVLREIKRPDNVQHRAQTVRALIRSCPDALRETNRHGQNLFQLVADIQNWSDDNIGDRDVGMIADMIALDPETARATTGLSEGLRFMLFSCTTSIATLKIFLDTWPHLAKEPDRVWNTSLHLAVKQNRPASFVEEIIAQWPESIHRRDLEFERTPLHWMYLNSNPAVVQLLVDAVRADGTLHDALTAQDVHGDTPLHCLSNTDTALTLASVLVLLLVCPEAGDMVDDSGQTPLCQACARFGEDYTVFALLVHNRQNALRADNNGRLPLHYARTRPIVDALLSCAPATATTPDRHGQLALHVACDNQRSFDVIKLLLEAAPVASIMPDRHGTLPLHLACRVQQGWWIHFDQKQSVLDVLAALLTAGWSAIERPDYDGLLPFQIACANDDTSLDVIYMLVRAAPGLLRVETRAETTEEGATA